MKKLLLAAAGLLLSLAASAQTWVNIDKLLYVLDDTDNTAALGAPYRCPLSTYDDNGYYDDVVVPAQIQYGGKTYTVTSVMNEAFYLKQPKTISFPETLKSIGDEVFYGVSTLEKLVLPNSVESIGAGCFYQCSGLKEITLGTGMKTIAGGTPANFYRTPLEKLTCLATVPPTTAGIASIGQTIRRDCILYVPAGCKAAYESQPNWTGYKEIVELPAEPGPGVGIEAIDADNNAETRYFNMQGIEVNEPAKGQMLIEVKGAASRIVKF